MWQTQSLGWPTVWKRTSKNFSPCGSYILLGLGDTADEKDTFYIRWYKVELCVCPKDVFKS